MIMVMCILPTERDENVSFLDYTHPYENTLAGFSYLISDAPGSKIPRKLLSFSALMLPFEEKLL